MPTAHSAADGPAATAIDGTSAPAGTPPSGTPVCFSEKISATRCGGAVRTSRCELAGVTGP